MVTWGCSRVLPTDLVSENAEGWQQPLASHPLPVIRRAAVCGRALAITGERMGPHIGAVESPPAKEVVLGIGGYSNPVLCSSFHWDAGGIIYDVKSAATTVFIGCLRIPGFKSFSRHTVVIFVEADQEIYIAGAVRAYRNLHAGHGSVGGRSEGIRHPVGEQETGWALRDRIAIAAEEGAVWISAEVAADGFETRVRIGISSRDVRWCLQCDHLAAVLAYYDVLRGRCGESDGGDQA